MVPGDSRAERAAKGLAPTRRTRYPDTVRNSQKAPTAHRPSARSTPQWRSVWGSNRGSLTDSGMRSVTGNCRFFSWSGPSLANTSIWIATKLSRIVLTATSTPRLAQSHAAIPAHNPPPIAEAAKKRGIATKGGAPESPFAASAAARREPARNWPSPPML